MKNKIMILMFVFAIVLSGTLGFSRTIHASNDKYAFSFYNGNASSNTSAKTKTTSKKVYVHLVSGPAVKITVQGSSSGSSWSNRSSKVTVYSGTIVRIANTVYEHNEHSIRLHIERQAPAYVNTTGYWNPDPS